MTRAVDAGRFKFGDMGPGSSSFSSLSCSPSGGSVKQIERGRGPAPICVVVSRLASQSNSGRLVCTSAKLGLPQGGACSRSASFALTPTQVTRRVPQAEWSDMSVAPLTVTGEKTSLPRDRLVPPFQRLATSSSPSISMLPRPPVGCERIQKSGLQLKRQESETTSSIPNAVTHTATILGASRSRSRSPRGHLGRKL